MAKYAFQFNKTADTTLAVGGIVANATPRRVKMYDFIVGSEATPADNPFLWTVDRGVSTSGTFTGVTPSPLDPGDSVALSSGAENYTANGTLGVNVLAIPLNQRATFRWVAFPGSEVVMAAATSGSILWRTPTSTAVAVTGTALFEE